jgi:hypothetical protein
MNVHLPPILDGHAAMPPRTEGDGQTDDAAGTQLRQDGGVVQIETKEERVMRYVVTALLALAVGIAASAPAAHAQMPSAPTYQIVTPTPGTGTMVIERQPPASGSGPSIPTYQVVVPGPNPAQNTGVGLGQQLSTPGSTVTVYPTPVR